jgi:hypothetical protein
MRYPQRFESVKGLCKVPLTGLFGLLVQDGIALTPFIVESRRT